MTGYPKKRKRDIKDVFGSRGKESKKICERERGAGGGVPAGGRHSGEVGVGRSTMVFMRIPR